MEDAHAAILDLHAKYTGPTDEKPTDPDQRLAFFGVYDGHGGDKVALFTGENLHKIVSKQESFAKGDIEQALKDGFLATDRAILEGSCPPVLARERRTTLFPFPFEEMLRKTSPKSSIHYTDQVISCRPEIRGGSVWLHRLHSNHLQAQDLGGTLKQASRGHRERQEQS